MNPFKETLQVLLRALVHMQHFDFGQAVTALKQKYIIALHLLVMNPLIKGQGDRGSTASVPSASVEAVKSFLDAAAGTFFEFCNAIGAQLVTI